MEQEQVSMLYRSNKWFVQEINTQIRAAGMDNLPEHTVIPSPNLPKKLYSTNIAKETANENTGS